MQKIERTFRLRDASNLNGRNEPSQNSHIVQPHTRVETIGNLERPTRLLNFASNVEKHIAILPVNQFCLTKQDTEHDFSYDLSTPADPLLFEPYVERCLQVTNSDAFLTSITKVEARISDVTLITSPGKSEAVNSYLNQVVRTWASRGVKIHMQYEHGAHARYINFSSGLRIRCD